MNVAMIVPLSETDDAPPDASLSGFIDIVVETLTQLWGEGLVVVEDVKFDLGGRRLHVCGFLYGGPSIQAHNQPCSETLQSPSGSESWPFEERMLSFQLF